MYYVYVLKYRTKGQLYFGYTENLKRRFKEHTSQKPELIYYEAYRSEKDARMREAMLKHHGQTKRRLKERLTFSLT